MGHIAKGRVGTVPRISSAGMPTLLPIVAGKIEPLECHILTPRACEYHVLHSKRGFADVFKVIDPKIW